ncbi:MAG: PepSY-associated TM helix domain-containing protein, partial [Paracoccaceae bacterium]
MQTQMTGAAARPDSFYFTAWRWHFYAGIYVAPFLIMLALTGLVMLWVSATTEINGERSYVTVTGAPLAVSAQAAAAVAAVPGEVVQYIAPMGPDRVAVFKVEGADGATGVAVNPYDGAVVERFVWGDGWYEFANDVHGSLLLGDFGDMLIEIAASLGVILIATGLYLWWSREGARAALRPNLRAKGRSWWKSLHQVTGVGVAGLLVVFLISGLSWTGVWGAKIVQAWNTFPAAKWDNVPLSDETHA